MPEPIAIENRPFWARILLVVWSIEAVVGLLFAWAGVKLLGPGENGAPLLLVAMGLLLAAAGVIQGALCLTISRIRGAAIELSDAGLRDRRLSPNLLPWETISWRVIFNGRSYSLQFDLAEPVRSEARVHWPQRALGLLNRQFKQPEFSVVALGTGHSAHQLAKRFEAFKPATLMR